MILSFFTVTNDHILDIKTYTGELFADFSPILMLIVSVLIGLAIIGSIIRMLRA